MREVVLLQKTYDRVHLEKIRGFLNELCEGLKAQLPSFSATENGWVKVTVSGEDENVAVRLLEKRLGLAPIAAENVPRFSVIKGRISSSKRSKVEIFVDIGVLSPNPVYATVPLRSLQGQLADGLEFALERVVELFGLVEGFPLEVQVIDVGLDRFSAELTEKQLAHYSRWVDSRVDRLVVLEALGERVRKAIRKADLGRFVLGVESLGFSEHVVVCRLGTDAAGLVLRLGRLLPGARLVVFSPRRVLEVVGERWE